MVLNCLSPMVPAGVVRVGVLSAAGVLTAICGVAGGSSKATLSAHFVRCGRGSLGDLNAVCPLFLVSDYGWVLNGHRKTRRRRLSSRLLGCWSVSFLPDDGPNH